MYSLTACSAGPSGSSHRSSSTSRRRASSAFAEGSPQIGFSSRPKRMATLESPSKFATRIARRRDPSSEQASNSLSAVLTRARTSSVGVMTPSWSMNVTVPVRNRLVPAPFPASNAKWKTPSASGHAEPTIWFCWWKARSRSRSESGRQVVYAGVAVVVAVGAVRADGVRPRDGRQVGSRHCGVIEVSVGQIRT